MSGPSVLEQVLDVRYSRVEVPGHGWIITRAYNGGLPGPTLRVRAGDTLLLTHVNGLPPNPAQVVRGGPSRHGSGMGHRPNSFNLHAHGMHVSPAGPADNVLREFAPRTGPGEPEPRYRTVLHVPPGHPAGTYLYHPHLHGSTAEQMAGDIDEVPEVAAAADVVVCVNELKLRSGRVPPFDAGAWMTGVPSVFTVNGAVNPVLSLRPGEVQRWRLVGATAFTALTLHLTGPAGRLTMHRIAQDGITLPAPVPAQAVELVMGNRVDVLVKGGAPGRYELRADGVPHPLLSVEVSGPALDPPMALPRALPPGRPFLDEREVTGPDREVLFHVDPGVFPCPSRTLSVCWEPRRRRPPIRAATSAWTRRTGCTTPVTSTMCCRWAALSAGRSAQARPPPLQPPLPPPHQPVPGDPPRRHPARAAGLARHRRPGRRHPRPVRDLPGPLRGLHRPRDRPLPPTAPRGPGHDAERGVHPDLNESAPVRATAQTREAAGGPGDGAGRQPRQNR